MVSLLSNQGVKYAGFAILLLDAYYFAGTMDALSNPLVHVGIVASPIDDVILSCEVGLEKFRNERNAYITGFSLFMFLVLRRLTSSRGFTPAARTEPTVPAQPRRLVDIQSQLFHARETNKQSSRVPVGKPVEESGKPKRY